MELQTLWNQSKVYFQTNYLFSIFIALLIIMARFSIYKKAGHSGWASIIPFYSEYVWFKISGMDGYLFLYSVIGTVLGEIASQNQNTTMAIVALVFLIIGAIDYLISEFKLARKFSKGFLFGLGLVFLNPIFILILGFGKNKYQG